MSLERFDPITLEILWAKIISALDKSATALMRTSFSPILREANDFACVLTDTRGHSIGQSPLSLPSFLNTVPITIQNFLQRFPPGSLHDGDVLITNDPWIASGHLPDVTLAMPVFYRGRLVAMAGVCGHLSDIGGRQRSADARELYEEGLQIPPLKLLRAGEVDSLVRDFIATNVRIPDEVFGDLTALISALEVTRARIVEMMEDYHLADLAGLGRQVQALSEKAMRKAISEIPDGDYIGSVMMDGYDQPLKIRCTLRVHGSDLEVDYAGSSPRQARGINSVHNYTYAYTVYPIKCVIDPLTRNNAGSLRPITVTAPRDSIVNPCKPAPVGARSVTGHMLHEAIFECLSKAVPERVQASSYGPGWAVTFAGAWPDGRPYAANYVFTGGQGASKVQDGLSCVRFPSNVCNTPIEMIENAVPARIEQKGLIPDSGGLGTNRGGLGQRVAIRILGTEPVTLSLIADRLRAGAPGLLGGMPGRCGKCTLSGSPFDSKHQIVAQPGDLIAIDIPGGGGYGPPADRDSAAFARDLREGYVTLPGWKTGSDPSSPDLTRDDRAM